MSATHLLSVSFPSHSPLHIPPNFLPSKGVVFWVKKKTRVVCSASSSQDATNGAETKRRVVEHICLLKAKEDLSEQEEKDMLDYLYTTQYHMSGIVAISLGQTAEKNPENFTHGVYMRFHRRQDLAAFYENAMYLNVLKEHVTPRCHGIFYADFEGEVQDDILAIFRKGEEFNYGVESVILIKFLDSAPDGSAEFALASLAKLTAKFPSLIVQSTQGCNFNSNHPEYTHVVLIRFRSIEAQQIFFESSEYRDLWGSQFQPICQKTLSLRYLVDPVGTELM